MSYCRWSSDNWKSDVYVYQSAEAFCIHVAGRRLVGDAPEVPSPIGTDFDDWYAAHRAQMAWMEKAERANIELPYAGDSFYEATAAEAVDRLKMLQALGYHVPQYAIESLEEEIEEED